MSYLKEIFCNPVIEAQVKTCDLIGLQEHQDLTLRDCLIKGTKWDANKVRDLKIKGMFETLYDYQMNTWDYDNPDTNLKDFKLYNQREIQHAKIRASFLKRMERITPMRNLLALEDHRDQASQINHSKLTDLTYHAFEYPNILLSLKGFILAHYWENDFKGLVPCSSPISKATWHLFKIEHVANNYAHTELCVDIGKEIGKSRMYVNTALWVIGDSLTPKQNTNKK